MRNFVPLLAFGVLLGAAATCYASLDGSTVTGTLLFQYDPTNYFDPTNGYVPTGYGNVGSFSVTIDPNVKTFGFNDDSNLIEAAFAGNNFTLTQTNVCCGAGPWTLTFIDTAFTSFTQDSDTFTGGLQPQFDPTTHTFTITWNGDTKENWNYSAAFHEVTYCSPEMLCAITPEPSTLVLTGSGGGGAWRVARQPAARPPGISEANRRAEGGNPVKTENARWFGLILLACTPVWIAAQTCTVTPAQQAYFNKIGIGADYGPHYPCYSNGAVADCYENSGSRITANLQDAKNFEMQASTAADISQMTRAGFQSVRGYGFDARVWASIINYVDTLNTAKKYNPPLTVVYQFSACKSDQAAGSACIDQSGNIQSVVAFSRTTLKQTIQLVTPQKFQRVVKLMIVGNEDLVVSQKDGTTYNTQDLIYAIDQAAAELSADGVTSGPGGIDLSSGLVINQALLPQAQPLINHFTAGAPVIENVYPEQFAGINTPQQAMDDPNVGLKKTIANMQQAFPNRPAMLGEVGWWTQGTDPGYQNQMHGTVDDALGYLQLVYPYARSCKIPTLVFELYDEPPKPATSAKPGYTFTNGLAEEHYGVLDHYNVLKNDSQGNPALKLLPNPVGNINADSSRLAIFKFQGNSDPGWPSTYNYIVLTVPQPTDPSPTKYTLQAFDLLLSTGGKTPIWPTFNLTVGSKVSLYRAVSGPVQCSNTVTAIFPNPNGVAPYSGGTWQYSGITAPGCVPGTSTAVNWADGANVFAPDGFWVTKPKP